MTDERLTEIRDLLVQLLEHAREESRKREVVLEEQRAAIAVWRRYLRLALGCIVLVLGILALTLLL